MHKPELGPLSYILTNILDWVDYILSLFVATSKFVDGVRPCSPEIVPVRLRLVESEFVTPMILDVSLLTDYHRDRNSPSMALETLAAAASAYCLIESGLPYGPFCGVG